LISAKVLTALATAGGLSVGGAVYAGVMPDVPAHPSQRAANDSTDPTDSTDPSTDPTDPAGASAYGLCNAWAHNTVHGQGSTHGQAFLGLAAAAGGAANVVTYCATVPHPSTKPTPAPGTDVPSGKPTSHPVHPSHPAGKPATHPVHPSHPAGKPAAAHGHGKHSGH
jgi:hypothetical protein